MNRGLWLVMMVLACGKGEKAGPRPDRGASALLLAHLPADTDAIVAGSVTDLARWPLWRRAVGAIAHEAPGIADRIARQCKLDPWTLVSSGALAFTRELDDTVLAAETSVDRTQLHGCAAEVGSDVALTIENGPLTTYRQADATELAAWTSERLVLALPQRMEEAEPLHALLAPRPVPQELAPLVERADRTATIWGVALATGDGFIAELLAATPLRTKPRGVHAAIHRTERLRARVALVFADAAGATDAKKLFDALLADPPPWLAAWKDGLRIETAADEMRIVLDLDSARAKQLDDALIALLPAPTAPPPRN